VLLDLHLANYSGLAALEYFREWHDDTPVVVLSATRDAETIRKALALGTMGYIPKTRSTREELRAAIKFVLSGGVYIPPEVMLTSAPESASEGNRSPHTILSKDRDRSADVKRRILSLTTPASRKCWESW
jgi:DNA-binding NarL/FixJ family response regulator